MKKIILVISIFLSFVNVFSSQKTGFMLRTGPFQLYLVVDYANEKLFNNTEVLFPLCTLIYSNKKVLKKIDNIVQIEFYKKHNRYKADVLIDWISEETLSSDSLHGLVLQIESYLIAKYDLSKSLNEEIVLFKLTINQDYVIEPFSFRTKYSNLSFGTIPINMSSKINDIFYNDYYFFDFESFETLFTEEMIPDGVVQMYKVREGNFSDMFHKD
jgi:hypothetical protein